MKDIIRILVILAIIHLASVAGAAPKASPVWSFQVKAYRIEAGFSQSLPSSQPSLTVIDLSSSEASPAAGRPNAVAYFYWPGHSLPKQASAVHNSTLELHYPLSALGGVIAMLKGKAPLLCYYDPVPGPGLVPSSGLKQTDFTGR